MLEGLAAWILNTYVGEYLENLNTDQLSIGLLQGEVELENLPLKKDALKELELPVEIRAGFVGKIKLQIPVRRLRSEPWVIYIEKLFLIAGPVLSSEYDQELEERSALSRKLARLEILGAKWKGITKTKEEGSYYTNWMVYGTSLMANIIENVQLKIKDVHIRYEDEQSCPNHTFACGIVIQSLTAQSSDQRWVPKFVRRDSSDTMWKLVQLDGLSLYWDPNAVVLGRLNPKEITAAMGKHLQTCLSPDGVIKNHDYILSPVNAEAHLTRNRSPKPLRSKLTPRIICDIHLQKIPLSLSEIQYSQIMEWLKEFEVLDVKWKHRKWRPTVSVKKNARKWWHYAISVYLEPVRARNKSNTWAFVLERSLDLVKYSNLYHEYLSNNELLTLDKKSMKEDLEKKLGLFELCALQEIIMTKIQRKNSLQDDNGEESKGKGFLQWMFPSWAGWYLRSQDTGSQDDALGDTESNMEVDMAKSHLEEEILDVLDNADNDSLLKRDTVFAQINFSLCQGTFVLTRNEPPSTNLEEMSLKPIVELEFSDVSTKVETRPRSSSFLFEIKLGALYLYDRIFSMTNFPHIIAPQNRDISLYTKTSGLTVFPLPSFLSPKTDYCDTYGHLFELLYEKKPFGNHADHRLNITTRSLDVVYNPQVLSCITDFFCLQHGKSSADFSVGELKLTAAARAKYEVLKQQTKAELQQKWDKILDSEDRTVHSSRWNIELAISAPQIIIPEDIFDKNSSVVVFDLGKLHFFNAVNEDAEKSISISEDIDDDDDFITPCSTPQELLEQIESNDKLSENSISSPLQLKEHIYEKYTLELNNIQVLVSHLKDNWKFAQLRGTSTMHILDRFSITVQTERRMVYTQDPEWPCIAVTGNLPKLIVHVSEQKVNALQTCIDVLNTPVVTVASDMQPANFTSREKYVEFLNNFNERSSKEKKQIVTRQITDEQGDQAETALLLLMEFCVDQMSFDVQSRGHSVAELQVTGVKTTFSKRAHDISLTLCVHSLLLVDALQTYGPDFELLLASHKHLSMDSTSGSLRDSEPSSPASPGSPTAISSPQLRTHSQTGVTDLSAALVTLQSSKKAEKWSSSLHIPKTEHYTSDALIIVEVHLIESTSDYSEVLQIANVQFNNLDVIANQETIVELVGFLKRIALHRTKRYSNVPNFPAEELKSVQEREVASSKHITRTEITFDFHRLNILLLRALSQKHSSVGQKVATTTVSGARIQATIGKVIEIHGTLGGLQVLDLITENTKHKKIISIGYDPLTEQNTDLLSRLQEEMYKPIMHSVTNEPQNALSFAIVRGENSEASSLLRSRNHEQQQGYLNVNLRMASLCYTHSPRLLQELSSCATEFKDYMGTLASSIKTAATEVAMGIVSKRTESISATIHGMSHDVTASKAHFDSITASRTRLESMDDLSEVCYSMLDSLNSDVSVELRLDVLLQTPVVAFPSSPQSSNVLVAHLGRIAIQNGAAGSLNTQQFSMNLNEFNQAEVIFIEVRDMNMHFVNIDKISLMSSTVLSTPEGATLPTLSVKDLYTCEDKNDLIIHDTVIEVVVETHQKSEIMPEAVSCFATDQNDHGVCYEQKQTGVNSVEVKGRVVTPLKVVLTKSQFQQMLKVLDNLTCDEEYAVEDKPSAISMLKTPPSIFSTKAQQTSGKQSSSIIVSFELPDLIAELKEDLSDKEGIVSLTFQEFILEYKTEKAYEASLQVTLQTLLMEDLSNATNSKQCYLMSSINHSKMNSSYRALLKSEHISSSCPSLTEAWPDFYNSSCMSLPDKLHTQNMFSLQTSSNKRLSSSHKVKSKEKDSYPSTPPPSPSSSKLLTQVSQDALVFINVSLIDSKSPLFSTKYKKTHRIIDIDFNCLDIALNLHTWVMVLDFFSLSSESDEKMESKKLHLMHTASSFDIKKNENELEREVTNSEISLKVKSLTVMLNKHEYKLASANVSNFVSDMSLREHTYTVKGTLGSISVTDLTPYGHLYPEKFVTTGSEALHFHFFRYSQKIPSWQIDYDMSLKCQMSSVQYVHTQRFLSETTAFFQHFNEMQDLIRKIRLAASGAVVSTEAVRGSRISLNIAAGSPVIVIPQNSSSTDVLVADLGKITVRNTFLPVYAKGSISYTRKISPDSHSADNPEFKFEDKSPKLCERQEAPSTLKKEQNKISLDDYECCLDVINVELTDMDLYSAVHISLNKGSMQKQEKYEDSDLLFPSFFVRKQGHDLLQQKFMLRVQIDRNIDSAISHQVPDWAIEGVVSSVYVTLDKKQYKLILGILNQNLGEPIEEFIYGTCNEVDQFIVMDNEQKIWTSMAIHMDLVNVTLELIRNEGIVNSSSECSLAKFDFIRSRLSYESFSDSSKDIDLVSNMVQVSDIRFKNAPVNNRPNVFTKVLQPTNTKENSGSTLQAEIHYRMTRDFSRLTVLLNNMRIMGVFEFLKSVLVFLTVHDPTESVAPQQKTPNSKIVQKSQSHFEIKVNVTDTELVVVEDTALWDSNAVIVKSTAVITWKPKYLEKPLSCSLQSLEVFSCILGVEDETALSIIDPLTVGLEIVSKKTSPVASLQSKEVCHVLEISMVHLNLRLSYYDIRMFLKIFESMKHQVGFYSAKSIPTLTEAECNKKNIAPLALLGFSLEDCQRALTACRGDLNNAALWLTQNATPKLDILLSSSIPKEQISEDKEGINLSSMEIGITSCCLCIIDDCRDADVPIIELTLSELTFLQKFIGYSEGYGNFVFSADYYNRALSGWEPVMEPWKCGIKWKMQPIQSKPIKRFLCDISTSDIINLNITSSLIELYRTVKKNWTEDYLNVNIRNKDTNSSELMSPGGYRRRSPFIPFVLKNDTGSRLWFATQITSANALGIEDHTMPAQNSKFALSWTEVPAGNLVPVPFGNRVKIRHKDSHEMKLHQIIVRVEGWMPVVPVSVDRVGTYFRNTRPQISHLASVYTERPSARVVFVVSLEGSARKLITVQSSLLIRNKLEDTMEVKLENSSVYAGVRGTTLFVVPNQTLPIPLSFVHAQMFARPSDKIVAFCNHPIAWQHVTEPGEIGGLTIICNSVQKAAEFYRFSVVIKRRNFPAEKDSESSSVSMQGASLPAHRITFIPCLELMNLLPYEIHYSVQEIQLKGHVKAGKGKPIYTIDVSKQFAMQFFLDNFKHCNEISISSTSRHYPKRIELRDNENRLLLLQLKVLAMPGNALKLLITAPYWLVNKTGLPLVYKQEGTNAEAAGQFEEHEQARCMAPLLFSFSDREASAMCNMRVGHSLHFDGKSHWCNKFSLDKGIRVRRLHIMRKDSRPDLVYNIGIDVRVGRGRYGETNIVTLSPRYQLDNQSTSKLEFCQLFATKDNRHFVLSAMPKCSLPLHWPRIDLDNLLCVRQPDIEDCHWSGGFAIDNIESFHINMRDSQGKSHFMRVEVLLQGATFFIVFTNADRLPPPFRIDNHSEVSITYYQTNVEQERLKTSVRPNSSIPYAFDEPTLPPYITCCAPGGSAATYNMNIFREGNQLFYENFIYIAFTGSFEREDVRCLLATPKEYVLDVPYGTKVVINRKEAGKRSQLWRMTSLGMLQHEGSSPPRDPHKPGSSNVSRTLVLDIAGLSPQPGEFIPLMLRKPDTRRQHTQTWKFTADGRLCCAFPNMYVQAQNGFKGLRRGSDVVLGPSLPVNFVTMENGVPMEQAISRQKLRGGSGVLSVKVIPDGPTRVLQISDIKQKQILSRTSPATDWVVVEEEHLAQPLTSSDSPQTSSEYDLQQATQSKKETEVQICLHFSEGLGISLINYFSEELVYIILHRITVEYSKASSSHSLDGSIKDIQIDNQLREAEMPVTLSVTQASKSDDQRHLPSLHFTVHRIESPLLNAEIFKHLIVTLKNLTIHLEERLILKLLQFAGFHQNEVHIEKTDESNNQNQRCLTETTAYEKRYYFSTLKLCLQQIKLSMLTTSNLQADLIYVKRKMRLRLIRFEDASIELNPFLRVHPFETSQFIIDSVVEHYKEELKSQAAKILGAVDFLGNPLGLMNDVTDGLSKLINEGNVGGLIKNVTHGLSDSAAKISETLSDGLGIVAMDDKHQRMRKRIRQDSAFTGNDHLMAGLKGLGFGLIGGMTSIFTQTYEGAAQEGVQGFFSGLGKGLVGTVTKPAVGFLDFASGAASAVRDTSKGSTHIPLSRTRPPRTCVGPGGLLPRYSFQQAIGQDFLYNLNNRDYSELFIAKEQIRSGLEDLHALISSERVYFLSGVLPSSSNVVLTVPFADLYKCSYLCSGDGAVGEVRHYLQLRMKADSLAGSSIDRQSSRKHARSASNEPLCKKPQVRCDSNEVAQKVTMQINYAKNLHEERTYMVISDDVDDSDEEK